MPPILGNELISDHPEVSRVCGLVRTIAKLAENFAMHHATWKRRLFMQAGND
jgi:hypothetical protein